MVGSCWRQPFLVLLRCLSSCATLGHGRCRSGLVAASGRAAHDAVGPVRWQCGGHRGGGLGRATGHLSWSCCGAHFFWSLRRVCCSGVVGGVVRTCSRPTLAIFSLSGAGSVMMSAAGSQFAIEARSTLLHLLHAPNARGRRARELSVEAVNTAALTGLRRGAAAYEPSDLSRASLHKNARATQGTPRVTASSAPKPIAARSTA